MVILNEKNGLRLEVDVYKEMKDPVMFVVDGKKRVQVNYSSGEMENDTNEFMINEEILDSISGARELVNEIVEYTDNIGQHKRITIKETQADKVYELYRQVKW